MKAASLIRRAVWPIFYAAFVSAAYGLRADMSRSGLTEIWGWDYGTFVGQINDWRWITYAGFRHPGLGLLMSPLVALQHVWADAYLWFMPAVATATAGLVRRLGGWCALAVWLALPTTWLLAGTPESFPVAQLALLASAGLLMQADGRRTRFGWCLAAGINGLVTLTNGGKVVLAWLLTRAKKRDVMRVAGAVVVVAVAGIAFFAVRAHQSGKDWTDGLRATLGWIPAERCLGREWWGFFIRPVGWVALVAYPLALVGLFRDRLRTKVFASFFVVDFVLHLVIGWGMSEPWVFAPHWTWMLAILAGEGVRCLWGRENGLGATVFCPGLDETANGMAVVARLLQGDPKWKDERIVHGAWLPSVWCACVRFGRSVRMPHGSYDPVRLAYHGWKKRLVGPVERFFLRRATKVLATCAAERDWILKYEPKAKVEVIDVKRYFRLEKDEREVKDKGEGERRTLNLLYLGRRHPLKGVEYLEQAVEEIKRNRPPFTFNLHLRIVSDAVGEEKERVWDWCDVLVLPTLSENFGLVVAEALARGKRVITTDGAPAWDGQCGVVYLKGYRDGDDETRIRLLADALKML